VVRQRTGVRARPLKVYSEGLVHMGDEVIRLRIDTAREELECVLTCEAYQGYRVRVRYSNDSSDALDSDAMSAVVMFDRGRAELRTGSGDELDLAAIGRAWSSFEDGEKLARWLVMSGEAHAVEIIQTPGFNSWGFLVAATPEWVRKIWTPKGEETTPEHVASAVAALPEEAKTVGQWIEGEVFGLVPEQYVTLSDEWTDAAGRKHGEGYYQEWREADDYGPVWGYIGEEYALAEGKTMLAEMISGELGIKAEPEEEAADGQ
jgi:hypothetical protein